MISVWVVKKPITSKKCGGALHFGANLTLPAGEPMVRFYGSAHVGEKPFRIYTCLECARLAARSCRKTAAALDDFDRFKRRK